MVGSMLLIVPYGIETLQRNINEDTNWLLIVPYGIETKFGKRDEGCNFTFNRTLWN